MRGIACVCVRVCLFDLYRYSQKYILFLKLYFVLIYLITSATVTAMQCEQYIWWYSYWTVWGSWSSCDHTCGGGNRVRAKTCLYPNLTYESESQRGACNQYCLNNGIYRSGKCHCLEGWKGYCCEGIF